MTTEVKGQLDGQGRRFALIVARFNGHITEQLKAGCIDTLLRHGVAEDAISVVTVPGAWEIPGMARRMVDSDQADAVICLGCVIRGATPHFDFVSAQCARGISLLSAEGKKPVVFGVLTTDSIEQALERAGTKHGNKGADAALTALEMCDLYSKL